MSAKIEINVGVNDGAFAAFKANFERYQSQLEKTPDTWKRLAQASEETKSHFEMMAGAMGLQADSMTQLAGHVSGLRRDSEATARHWHGMRLSTQGVARNIETATGSLLKWASIIGGLMISGATAAAAGTAHFAPIVAGNRTAAFGSGTTYGARSSFLTNFARLSDPEGFLGRVNEISHSADNIPLRALGLSQEEVQGDSADVGANAILQLKKLVDGIKNPAFLQDRLHANRADELISVNQAQILRGMSPEEVQGIVSAYRRDKSRLSLSDETQLKYQNFATQLDRDGKKIENTFVNRLGALTPGLTKLSESFTVVVDKLMADKGPLSQWLEAFDDGIEWLAKNIDKPEFQHQVDNLISGLGQIADTTVYLLSGIVSLAKWLGVSPAEASEATRRVSGAYGGGGSGSGYGGSSAGSGGGSGGSGASPSGADEAGGMAGAGNVPGAVFDLAARGEAAKFPGGGYNTILGGGQLPLTGMTLNQVMALHKDAGRWQLTAPTIAEFIKKLHLTGNEKFDPPMQKRIIGALLAETHGSAARLQGRFVSLRGAGHIAEIERAWHTPDAAKPDDSKWKETADVGADKRDLFAETPTNRDLQRGGKRPANTTTKITITKPTGADPHVAAAAAASQ